LVDEGVIPEVRDTADRMYHRDLDDAINAHVTAARPDAVVLNITNATDIEEN
jgi:hypothetical protein